MSRKSRNMTVVLYYLRRRYPFDLLECRNFLRSDDPAQNLQIMRSPSISSFPPSAANVIHHCTRIRMLWRNFQIIPQIPCVNHLSFHTRGNVTISRSDCMHREYWNTFTNRVTYSFMHGQITVEQFDIVSSIFRNDVSKHPSQVCGTTTIRHSHSQSSH